MNSDEESNTSSSSRVDKGKGKAQAEPTERTPLLGSASAGGSSSEVDNTSFSHPRRNIRSTLLNVFLGTLLLCIVAFLVVALLTWTYVSRTADLSPEEVLQRAVVFEGPKKVSVLNTTWTEGMWVNVEGRMGVDAGSVVGVNSDPEGGDSFVRNIWKSFGRWGIEGLHEVTLAARIFNASLNTANSRYGGPYTLCREAWRLGYVAVRAEIADVDVQGGRLKGSSWRHMLRRKMDDVKASVKLQIPPLPGLPQPGKNTPFPSVSELITLRNFTLSTISDELYLRCLSKVSLASNESAPIPIASVRSKAFNLTYPNITLEISGGVLPLPTNSLPLLSTFISRYLSALSNAIVISTPLVPDLTVEADFPPPEEKPRILRNVTIHDMKIKPGNTFLASGTVFARVVLPPGMHVGLDVKKVLPDVLVFDGEVPESAQNALGSRTPPPRRPLPDPLPEKAFGHIRPDDWLVSRCVAVVPEDDEGAAFAVTAKIVDVPLEVLPGRHQEFSDFVGKVIFGRDGAIAGILGTADVGVLVQGLPLDGPEHEDGMVLSGLPFKGSVRIGKKSMLSDYWTQSADHWLDASHHYLKTTQG
ncbi:hypothetical protein VNI00_000755 [Paramarasmius palmivorus]|uniref:Uncharacterized protein n=1 Tax=Paramarasmius palmivorus TaxID=297713 RepID=A0AAW0E9J2_9AGAR